MGEREGAGKILMVEYSSERPLLLGKAHEGERGQRVGKPNYQILFLHEDLGINGFACKVYR